MGHKIQMYENLRDMLEREIGDIEKTRDLTKDSLDNLYKLTTSLKVVDKCIMREEGEKEGGMSAEYSQARGYNSRNSYNRGSYDSRMMPVWSNDGMSNNSYGNSYDGQSMNYPMNNSNDMSNASYARRGRDGDSDGRYNEGQSRDNFRDNSNRGGSYGYSRDASRKKMVQKLETLMDDTMSDKERQAIQDCIEKIDK